MTTPRATCLLILALALRANVAAQTTDTSGIEQFVLRRLVDTRPTGRLALDVRSPASGRWGTTSDSALGRRLADNIAASYRSLGAAIVCDSAKRKMPGSGCRLSSDLDAYIVVSLPEFSGDSALVTISIARPQRSHQEILGDIYYRDETLLFIRRDSKWVFVRVKDRRMT
ncbi:MAG: hypothetical protein U0164_16670 [Gemmatimonadaceae bacterium]